MKSSSKKKLLFVVTFVLLGLGALQVSLSHLAGSGATFTSFDAFAPIAGAFIGTLPGMLAVFLMQAANFFIHGSHVIDPGTIVRFVTPLFGVLYFARKRWINLAVPVLAIVSFNLNPVGRSVWYFSLYWLIPVACYFLYERSIFARSFGATFTAHAVGGATWIWIFHLPAAVWIGLIPVVAIERLMFGVGIAVLYVAFTNVIEFLAEKDLVRREDLRLNMRYVWHHGKSGQG